MKKTSPRVDSKNLSKRSHIKILQPDQPQGENLSQISHFFEEARKAQSHWQGLSFEMRKSYLDRMREYILRNLDALVERIVAVTGKTRVDALADELMPAVFACKWYAENAQKLLAPEYLRGSIPILFYKKTQLIRLPLGVVGIISPWNYPFIIPFSEILMGLMAGNAIMHKGSPQTQGVADLIAEIMSESGLPQGLFHNIQGPPAEVADAFFKHKIDKIFFTGSVRVGKELMRKASEHLTPLSLELGGNDPMIVLADADLDRAAQGAAWAAYQNAGQTCAGVERVYVHSSVYKTFLRKLTHLTQSLRHGVDENFNVDVGAMITEEQYHKVKAQVDEAISKGAKIVAQSQAQKLDHRRYFPATLIVDVDHSMSIMQEETFGPVLCLMPFSSEDEAVRLANDSCYALTSSVWGKNLPKARELAARLESGVTTINDHIITHALSEVPWGGWKQSGVGRTHGRQGFEEMTHLKAINWDRLSSKRNIFWYPFDESTYEGLKDCLNFSFPQNPIDFLVQAKKFVPFALKKMFSLEKSLDEGK